MVCNPSEVFPKILLLYRPVTYETGRESAARVAVDRRFVCALLIRLSKPEPHIMAVALIVECEKAHFRTPNFSTVRGIVSTAWAIKNTGITTFVRSTGLLSQKTSQTTS